MKIAIFVTEAYYKKKDLYGVSGHVQIPLKAANLVAQSQFNIDIITTKPKDAEYLMIEPPVNLRIRTVIHATKEWPKLGVYTGKAILQFFQLLKIVRSERYGIVHFFGGPKTGLLGFVIKIFNNKTKVFFSPISEPLIHSIFWRIFNKYVVNKLDLIIPTSDYVGNKWAKLIGSEKIHVIKPGVLKKMLNSSLLERNIVLFWRNADYENGADLMVSSVKLIASEYKMIKFVFAIRPGSEYQEAILQLEREYSNVHVYIYPYQNGITIELLLRKALFVIAPYRRLSINPQMSILETLLAGVPIICSDVESNKEVIIDGVTGIILKNNNSDNIIAAIKLLLEDHVMLNTLTKNTINMTESRYNWNTFKEELLKIYRQD